MLGNKEKALLENNNMMSHMIFDVNLDAGFTRNYRFVMDWNKGNMPPLMTCVSVI